MTSLYTIDLGERVEAFALEVLALDEAPDLEQFSKDKARDIVEDFRARGFDVEPLTFHPLGEQERPHSRFVALLQGFAQRLRTYKAKAFEVEGGAAFIKRVLVPDLALETASRALCVLNRRAGA